MNIPKVSVIIPNFNGKGLLSSCLESLAHVNYSNLELIVVDNGSEDGSIFYLQKNFPKVKVLSLGANFGFGRAVNEGAKVAKGKYLMFLNNDTQVTKNFLYPLVSALGENRKIAACSQKFMLEMVFLNLAAPFSVYQVL